jgi:hypothetical protein
MATSPHIGARALTTCPSQSTRVNRRKSRPAFPSRFGEPTAGAVNGRERRLARRADTAGRCRSRYATSAASTAGGSHASTLDTQIGSNEERCSNIAAESGDGPFTRRPDASSSLSGTYLRFFRSCRNVRQRRQTMARFHPVRLARRCAAGVAAAGDAFADGLYSISEAGGQRLIRSEFCKPAPACGLFRSDGARHLHDASSL